jgi:hypothetical protein
MQLFGDHFRFQKALKKKEKKNKRKPIQNPKKRNNETLAASP